MRQKADLCEPKLKLSPRDFAARADEAFARGDKVRCVALIESLYGWLDSCLAGEGTPAAKTTEGLLCGLFVVAAYVWDVVPDYAGLMA